MLIKTENKKNIKSSKNLNLDLTKLTKNMSNFCLPVLQKLPLRVKNQTDYTKLFSFASCAVAVQYWVLRPETKNNT